MLAVVLGVSAVACTASRSPGDTAPGMPPASSAGGIPFAVSPLRAFDEPWAMAFLPDGRALVTERGGALLVVDVATGSTATVAGTPEVVVGGQGGLGDVILSPTYAADRRIYLSWVEGAPDGTSGAVVGHAVLAPDGSPRLDALTVVWRQQPKVTGQGHFAHRLAISPDGQHLFVTSGERQKFDPAQDLNGNLGKVLRLTLDGRPAVGNPLAGRSGVTSEIWSWGHRNPLGIAFDGTGALWVSEMGPRGGDEINRVLPGRNYGWPLVSNGSHYSGEDIPDHRPGDGFEAPAVWWNPSISPGNLLAYSGSLFPAWRGDLFVGALSGEALIRIDVDGTTATVGDTWQMGARIREVEQGPDGSIWLLEDGDGGRLLHLTPR